MIFNNWHLWKGNGWLLSDESAKKLKQFKCFDDAINWLFLRGHKDAARHFNKQK